MPRGRCVAVAQRGRQRREELVKLLGLSRVGTGEDLLDLVQEDEEGFAQPRLLGTPAFVQRGLLPTQLQGDPK